ncbi:hypothetical protein [Nonomuraea sediminis]|uniref:hypothetical protein n=1 Tax=Nonomuraea sediminis TaxID=2835864 RepID=UPI001BDD9D3C|nr:hypothetical protein [Nonomuraea sediminis]
MRLSWAPWLTGALATAYAILQSTWLLAGTPTWALSSSDLTTPRGLVIGACLAVIAVVAALKVTGGRWPLVVAAWALSLLLTCSAAMILLDFVGGILPGLGIPHDPAGFASRAACLVVAAFSAVTALSYQRELRGCARCSRIPRLAATPRWAYVAAYAAVAGFALRIFAQVALFGPVPFAEGPQTLVFEAGFGLAGVLLPLALVHRWGRIWPRWVLPLAGRRVPRWLVVGPGFAVAAALLAYFGAGLVQLTQETIAGTLQLPAFMWTAIPAYVLWGIGLAIASTAYYRATKPPCPTCHT